MAAWSKESMRRVELVGNSATSSGVIAGVAGYRHRLHAPDVPASRTAPGRTGLAGRVCECTPDGGAPSDMHGLVLPLSNVDGPPPFAQPPTPCPGRGFCPLSAQPCPSSNPTPPTKPNPVLTPRIRRWTCRRRGIRIAGLRGWTSASSVRGRRTRRRLRPGRRGRLQSRWRGGSSPGR